LWLERLDQPASFIGGGDPFASPRARGQPQPAGRVNEELVIVVSEKIKVSPEYPRR
jgi:hypothetical protein